jgi:hypothetical protein
MASDIDWNYSKLRDRGLDMIDAEGSHQCTRTYSILEERCPSSCLPFPYWWSVQDSGVEGFRRSRR